MEWTAEVWEKIKQKMPYATQKANEVTHIPYSVQDGQWTPGPKGIQWWTNGFWPASMWRMYLVTKNPLYKEQAERAELMLDEAWRLSETLHHDVGFIWMLSSGVNYRLTQNPESRERTVRAANYLMSRFNPHGFLRSWNGDMTGWAIIDCMMNLSVLYFASELFSDPRYKQIAVIHADTVLRHFIRPDGSVHHIVAFDPLTGEPVEYPRGQGIASGSSWSRGQAWAMYGFVISYLYTRDARYLDAAKQVSHYFIANVCDDWIPACDFRAPKEPVVKDNCAGVIAACALLELAGLVPKYEADLYRTPAVKLIQTAAQECTDFTENTPAIMTKCTGAYHSDDHHIAMVYGDYFFIEAMHRLVNPDAMRFF